MARRLLLGSYLDIPFVTRAYTTACVITTLAVQIGMVSEYDLYFNPYLILWHCQFWRLVTTFFFQGTLKMTFLFNIIFTYRYCRALEETSFRGKTSDFVMMFIFGAVATLAISFFADLYFMGNTITLMLVYVWSRRNQMVRMNVFGIITISFLASLLPLVILGFSLLLGNSFQVGLLGITVGHMYYFLVDVLPNLYGGFKILKTPRILKTLFDPVEEDPNDNPPAEDKSGEFDWGAARPPQPDEPQPEQQPPEERQNVGQGHAHDN